MTRAQFLQIQAECRKSLRQIAKLYPGAFTKDGKPLVATATFPKVGEPRK